MGLPRLPSLQTGLPDLPEQDMLAALAAGSAQSSPHAPSGAAGHTHQPPLLQLQARQLLQSQPHSQQHPEHQQHHQQQWEEPGAAFTQRLAEALLADPAFSRQFEHQHHQQHHQQQQQPGLELPWPALQAQCQHHQQQSLENAAASALQSPHKPQTQLGPEASGAPQAPADARGELSFSQLPLPHSCWPAACWMCQMAR